MRKNSNEWNKRRNREEYLKKRLVKTGYVPTSTAISKAYYKTHWLRSRYGVLPGMEAYEEVIRFIATQKQRYPISSKNFDWYDTALEVALNRVKGRRFTNAEGKSSVITTTDDVHQVIREMIRAAGVSGKMSSVKAFVLANA